MTIRQQPKPISDLVKSAIGSISQKQQGLFTEEDIVSLWNKAAGKEAGRHSQPVRLKGKTLIISVDSPIWIYQLNIKKQQIVKNLTRLLKLKEPIILQLRAGER